MGNEILTTPTEILSVSTALYWILGVTGVIIMGLIAVIGYFLRKSEASRELHDKKQEENYNAIKDMVSNLDKTINKLDTLLEMFSRSTEKTLDDHACSIKDHEKRITILEK